MTAQTQQLKPIIVPFNRPTTIALRLTAVLVLGYLILVGGGVTSNAQWQWQAVTWGLAIGLSVIWFTWRVVLQKAAWPVMGLEVVLLLTFFSAGLSWWLSTDWRMGAGRLNQLVGFLLVFYLALDCLDALPLAEIVIDALILISGIALAVGLLETYAYYQGRWDLLLAGEWYRPVTLLGHPNLLMGLANLMLPFGLLAWGRYQNVFSRTGLILSWLAYVAVTPFASSRGAMVGLAVMIGAGLIGVIVQRQSVATEKVIGQVRANAWWLAGAGIFVIAGLIGLFLYQSSHASHGGLLSRFIIWEVAAQVIVNNFWVGVGPGRFGFEAARYGGVPPGFWPIHAHSVFFQTFGEFGIIGVMVLVALTGRFGWLVWQAIQSATGSRRWQALAGGLALLGYGVQNIVDDQTHVTATMVPLMLVCALTLTVQPVTRGRLSLGWLAIPLMVGAAVQGQWLKAYYSFEQGRQQYQAGQWAAALESVQQAETQDPALAFYDTSAGLVAARLGDWSLAQSHFEKALPDENGLAMTHLNLGLARWQNGDRVGGLAAVQQAVTVAPGSETVHFILGQMAEMLDQLDLSEASYRQVLLMRPDWYSHSFWQATTVRQNIWSEMAGTPSVEFEVVDKVELALKQRDITMARFMLDEYLAESDYWQPRRLRMFLLEGDLVWQEGQIEYAMQSYERALKSLANPSLEGSGASFWNRYGIWLYEREPVPIDLVPGWPLLDYRPAEDLSRFEKLLSWASAHKSCLESRAIAQAIIDLEPRHKQAVAVLVTVCQ